MYLHHQFDHVFEGSPPPTISFLVCSLPRSGSSLLCDVLASTELAGAPTEFFDPNHMDALARIWGAHGLDEYLRALLARKTSRNGVFGFKAHYHQIKNTFGDRDLREVFPKLRFVYITRRDRVRQAVSFARAMRTEQWAAHQPARFEPGPFDAAAIGDALEWIEREEALWEELFANMRESPHRLDYEDLVHDVEGSVLAVMRFLGIELPDGLRVPSPTLERQSDSLSEQWVRRYLATRSGPPSARPGPSPGRRSAPG